MARHKDTPHSNKHCEEIARTCMYTCSPNLPTETQMGEALVALCIHWESES